MAVASDNKFPKVIMEERLSDGSDTGNPAADHRALFLGEDGSLHLRDSAGTVTAVGGAGGAVASDTIWDAAGDLAVGTGADTAAKLTKGSAGGVLAMGNSAVIWNAGTSFPASKATGDRYWRTDLGLECYWDGTRWVSTQIFAQNFSLVDSNAGAPVTTSVTTISRAAAVTADYDQWLVAAYYFVYVASTNDGSNYWTIDLQKNAGGTSIGTVTTAAVSANTHARLKLTIGALLGTSTVNMEIVVTKTSSPGGIYCAALLWYRIVAT